MTLFTNFFPLLTSFFLSLFDIYHKETRTNSFEIDCCGRGHLKSISFVKWYFLISFPPCHILSIFSSTHHSPVSFTKNWLTMTWNRRRRSWTLLPLPERPFQLPRMPLRKWCRSGVFNDFYADFAAGIDLFSLKYHQKKLFRSLSWSYCVKFEQAILKVEYFYQSCWTCICLVHSWNNYFLRTL